MIAAGFVFFAQSAVSFSAPAAPLARLLPALGKAVGLEMKVDAALAREVVLVKAKGVPRDDLLKRISEATGGEWRQDGSVYRLSLSPAIDAWQRRTEAVAAGEEEKARLQETIKMFGRQKGDGAPSGLAEAVLARLPAETLGGLGIRQRIVYSTHPTPMQRRLEPSFLQGLDLNRLRKIESVDSEGQTRSSSGPIATVLLVVQNDSGGEGISGRLIAADASGRKVREEEAMPFFRQKRPRGPSASRLPRPEATFDLTEEALALAKATARADLAGFRGSSPSNPSANVPGSEMFGPEDLAAPSVKPPASIFEPEKHEPLALLPGLAFERLADAEGLNLVAVLPDSSFSPMATYFASRRESRADQVESEARNSWNLDLSVQDGWLCVTPRQPAAVRHARIDRMALGTLMRDLAKGNDPSLAGQSAYAAAQPLVPFQDSLEGTLVGMVNGMWGRRVASSSVNGERQLLRIVRALGPNFTDGDRSFGSLPSSVRADIAAFLYGDSEGPHIMGNGEAAASAFQIAAAQDPFGTVLTERTIFLPKGIPNDARVRLDRHSQEVFFGLADSGVRPALSGEGVSASFSKRDDQPWKSKTNAPRLATYRPGKVIRLGFELSVPDQWQIDGDLYESQIDASGSPIAFDNLPQKIRDQVAKADKAVEEGLVRMAGMEQMQRGRRRVQP